MNLDQQRLGDYVLAEQLRQDKTGTVFRGFHATRKTEVAIKVLHERYGKDPALLARFRRDAQTLGRVEHPGLVAVLDHGESAQGPFVVMESLAGESLADRLAREGRLSLADTQEIVGAVASALAAAHRVRVVHRDLKADSIFLIRADGADGGAKVKVLDLGLARILGDQGDARSKELDQRADIQALGSVAYQMLSGHAPLAVSDLQDEGQGTGEGQRRKPARLSTHGVTVPSAVEAAILKALERKKKRRFSSMAEFAQAFGVTLSQPAAPAPAVKVIATHAPERPAASPVAARTAPPPVPVPVLVSPPAQARGPERSTTLAGLVAPLRELGRVATAKAKAQAKAHGRRQIVAAVGGVSLAVIVIIWLVVRSGGQTGPVAVEVTPPGPPGQPQADRTVGQPPARPVPPASAPSRVDEILALNHKAVSAYGHSDLKTARALLQEADKLAVANGYQDAMVRAQTQVRLGALWIGGEKNPRVGRRYLAKAVAINPAVKLPADMSTPQVRKALAGVRKKARVDTGRVQKRALHAKAARRHGREPKRAR